MTHFKVTKFQSYKGPSYYLDRQAFVFNLTIDPDAPGVEHYRKDVLSELEGLRGNEYEKTVDLFASTVMEILKMDINLYLQHYSINRDGDDYVIAVEYLDDLVAEDVVLFTADWFEALTEGLSFDFKSGFAGLQKDFDKTYFGGPTFYSIYEAALKRDIPVHYLKEEGQFQWGYGKKQIRGRSTTVSTDGIKDTEFTMYKDMVAEFLDMCGFPTPKGATCFSEDEVAEEAGKLSYPLVVKPVAGHKGQGVSTNLRNEEEVRKAFRNIADHGEESEFAGIIVQQQIEGTDHRLLSVNGQFVAALQRVPAYVDGDGSRSIRELIDIENDTVQRLDNARSPLCKIKFDDDLKDFLEGQKRTLDSVPEKDERIVLRRVANISAGGVSINVTDKIHPANIKLVQDIAAFFNVNCLGIDVLADDIGKPWTDGNFGIIEINAGPGVFMHLAPAIGGSIDVPGIIMKSYFPTSRYERIPIIAGNIISTGLASGIADKLKEIKPDLFVGTLTDDGVFFNNAFFYKNDRHDQNVKIILRHPKVGFAIFHHGKDSIWDYGLFHQGEDIAILCDPGSAESCITRDLLPDGYLIQVWEDRITVNNRNEEISSVPIPEGKRDDAILEAVSPLLEELIHKYGD